MAKEDALAGFEYHAGYRSSRYLRPRLEKNGFSLESPGSVTETSEDGAENGIVIVVEKKEVCENCFRRHNR